MKRIDYIVPISIGLALFIAWLIYIMPTQLQMIEEYFNN